MNKNKGIWLVIAAILVIGMGVTCLTSRFIRQNGGSLDTTAVQQMTGTTAGGGVPQPYTEAGAPEAPAAARGRLNAASSSQPKEDGSAAAAAAAPAPQERQTVPEAAAYSAVKEADEGTADASESAEVKSESANETILEAADAGPGYSEALIPSISPLGPAAAAGNSGTEEKLAYHEKRLAEVDARVQKMRSESSDSTTYSMKTLAEKELQLWNIEMNTLYAEIAKSLNDDGKAKLENDQLAWIKSRDTKAEEAARKYSGGSLEGVEYTASLAESTKERAYSLVYEYIDVLPAENEE